MTCEPVCGLLLTGGTSRRMGKDKASLPLAGVPMGVLAGRALLQAAGPVLAIGPDPGLGVESLIDAGRGPLAAIADGMEELARRGLRRPVLVAACDLPFLTPAVLGLLAAELGPADAAVPVLGGRLQPLAACYSPTALPAARRCLDEGRFAMRDLLGCIEVREVPEHSWRPHGGPQALMDVDTPEDLRAAGELAGVRA